MWPSGKATGSGPVIGGSNPSTLAMKRESAFVGSFFMFGRASNIRPRRILPISCCIKLTFCLLVNSFGGVEVVCVFG